MARTCLGIVTSTDPVLVVSDGDPVNPFPAVLATAQAVEVGSRVRLELRTPLAPFVVAVLS